MRVLKSKLLGSIVSLGVLAACATPTPYAPVGDSVGYGYSDTQIETDRFSVRFEGNTLTDRETVENYLLYRAAELTLEQGFDYFIAVERQTDEETRFRSTGHELFSPFYRSARHSYYHPLYGWSHRRDPFRDNVELREVRKYEASVEIVLRKGPKPKDNVMAYRADDVLNRLAGLIVLPVDE